MKRKKYEEAESIQKKEIQTVNSQEDKNLD